MDNKPMRILLIEDNPGDAFLIKFYLEESVFKDARLIHAEFLNTAKDLLSKNEFDVILLDLNLPDSKGIETLKEVLENSNHSVVIVLTGLNDEDLGLETVKMGAQDFLVKGQFDGKVFTSSVRYAFERYRLQKQVDHARNAVDAHSQQLANAEDLLGFAYWELNLKDNTMEWSDKLYELLQTPKNEEQPELKQFVTALNGGDGLEASFKKAIENGGEMTEQVEVSGAAYTLRSHEVKDEHGKPKKMVGVLKKA